MNTTVNPEALFFITPVTGDEHDRPYRFGKPLMYVSDRQQVRLLILRGELREARAAQDMKAV